VFYERDVLLNWPGVSVRMLLYGLQYGVLLLFLLLVLMNSLLLLLMNSLLLLLLSLILSDWL